VIKRIIILVLFAPSLVVAAEPPERKVEDNVIISERDPKVRIELPKSVHYVGADRWVLYDMADCELHAFVDGDSQQNAQGLYWIQFERYLPSKPDLKHQYDSPRHTTIGGLDFYVDIGTGTQNDQVKPGSDTEHIRELLRARGYKMPAETMYVRFVHLLDEQKRKELMIIYGEDLASTGFTAADLKKGGKAYDKWPAIEKSLVERAEKRIKIEQTAKP
jgi:hypothetical protein